MYLSSGSMAAICAGCTVGIRTAATALSERSSAKRAAKKEAKNPVAKAADAVTQTAQKVLPNTPQPPAVAQQVAAQTAA